MEVLELKPIKNKKVIIFIFAKENSEELKNSDPELLAKFLKNKNINFLLNNLRMSVLEYY